MATDGQFASPAGPFMEPASSDPTPWTRRMVLAAGILVVSGFFLFGWDMSHRGIWSAHEGRAAQNASSMLQTGDWLIPRLFTDEIDVQKPPLYYWSVAAISAPRKHKVTPLTVRMPATISAIVGLILILAMGTRMWNLETGIFAAVILATTTRYAWLSRVGRIDMPLTILCTASLYFFWRHYLACQTAETGKNANRTLFGMYALAGFAVLLKGPVAILLILIPIMSFLLLNGIPFLPGQQGAVRTWSNYRLGLGTLIVLAIAGPWFAYAIWHSKGDFFWDFFVYHNLERALGTSEELKAGPFWFYIPRFFVDAFPWSLLMPALVMSIWKHRGQWKEPVNQAAPAYLFLIAWIVSQFTFLSLVSFKRPDYLLPIFPAFALLLAGWLTDRAKRFSRRIASRPVRNPRRRARVVYLSALVLSCLTAPLLVWATIEFLKKGVVRSIFKIGLVEKYLNVTDRFMMEHVEKMLRDNWPLLGIAGCVIVGCIWTLHTGWHERRNRRIVASLAVPWLVCFAFQVHLFLPAIDPLREMARFGELIRMIASEDRTIYYFAKFDADLVFHAGRPARMVGDWDDLARLGMSQEPCFVVMKASHFEHLQRDDKRVAWVQVADNRQTAFGEHREARVLITNHPRFVATIPDTLSAPQ